MIKYFCDLCEKELKGWEDNSGFLKIEHEQSCGNPLNNLWKSEGGYQRTKINIDKLCFTCQRSVSNAIEKPLKELFEKYNKVK